MVEEPGDGGLVVVVDPGGDGQRAGGPAVGDDGQTGAHELHHDGVLVGGVDDDRAVEGDVGPQVVPRGSGQDHQGVSAGQGGGGRCAGHFGEVRELREGERFFTVRRDREPDQAGLPGAEGAGGGGRAVAEALGDLADVAAGGVGQTALAVEGVGDSRDRDTGRGGDIADARAPAQPAPPVCPACGRCAAYLMLLCCCHGAPIVGPRRRG